jgi:hypothetical protein
MRAILIDPFTRTVSEVETSAELLDMYDLLQVDCITVVRVDPGHAMILDDEGLLKSKDVQTYFRLKGGHQPFAGRAMILGDKYGDNRDASLSLEEVKDAVVFLDNKDVEPERWLGWAVTVF